MQVNFMQAMPVLASLNIQESIDYYCQQLGFMPRLQLDNYAIVSRDGVELHFWHCTERHIAENTSCYVYINDIQTLYEEFKGRNLNVQPPKLLPWGMKEIYVIDVHGNLLKFGEKA